MKELRSAILRVDLPARLGPKSQSERDSTMAPRKRAGFHHRLGVAAVQPGSEPVGLFNLGLSRSKSVRKPPTNRSSPWRKPSRRRGMRCLMIWLNEWLIAGLDASKRVSMQKEDILNKFLLLRCFLLFLLNK